MIAVNGRICQCCRERAAARPRQLCHRCYKSERRLDYPRSDHPFSRPRTDLERPKGGRKLIKRPKQPTDAEPGSEAKILVMIARAKRRETVDHPGDRGMDDRDRDGSCKATR